MQHDKDIISFEKDMAQDVTVLVATDTVEVTPRSPISTDNYPLQVVEGINFWKTYIPVVSWRTVRLTLVLSILSGLKSA